MLIAENIESFMLTRILAESGKKSLLSDEDLLEARALDSMGIMKLILHIEQDFGIKVEDEDIVPENFQNLNSIVAFIERKMQDRKV
jgi:acyl carrier protein